MFDEISYPERITLEYTQRAQEILLPAIQDQVLVRGKYQEVVDQKSADHLGFRIDVVANQILLDILDERKLNCHLFSEETGWQKLGDIPRYYVVCDPYCNSSLTMRGFRESAVAICLTTLEGVLVSCAIADLQINRIFYADNSRSSVWEYHEGKWDERLMRVSDVSTLDKAFVVGSSIKKFRRTRIINTKFFNKSQLFHTVDGAIMIGRLADGQIDAYLDPFKGQPLYEIPCCEMIQRAGGIVTDASGTPFNLSKVIQQLIDDPKARYPLVASCSKSLHREILNDILTTMT
jgi:fructose-1,6-bisphosphatase/inositol monophosphatase family enzyme